MRRSKVDMSQRMRYANESGPMGGLTSLLRGEAGMTFAGQLVALAILGVTISVLISGLFTSGAGALTVRQEVDAQNIARTQMEAIKRAPFASSYTPLPTSSNYSVDIAVEDIGAALQKVTITVTSVPQSRTLCQLQSYKRGTS